MQSNENIILDNLPSLSWIKKLDIPDDYKEQLCEFYHQRKRDLRNQQKELKRQQRALEKEENFNRKQKLQEEKRQRRAAMMEEKRRERAEAMVEKRRQQAAAKEEKKCRMQSQKIVITANSTEPVSWGYSSMAVGDVDDPYINMINNVS